MSRLTLSEIWIYPIKSLGGIRLSSARVMKKGLYLDRRWMLIDQDNVFMTQRIHPAMALFKLSIENDQLRIAHKEEFIHVPIHTSVSGPPVLARVWEDAVTVYEVPGHYSAWFSERLGLACRLVFFPEENERPVDERYRVGDDQVSLADAYPILLIGQSSLDDLNKRLQEPVPMNRFRPNFVFTGGMAYEEDGWRNFTINKKRFVGVKPCSRCVLTTVDQETAEKGKEPLATLATYRRKENKILFGQNVIAIDYEEIFEGDELEVE